MQPNGQPHDVRYQQPIRNEEEIVERRRYEQSGYQPAATFGGGIGLEVCFNLS